MVQGRPGFRKMPCERGCWCVWNQAGGYCKAGNAKRLCQVQYFQCKQVEDDQHALSLLLFSSIRQCLQCHKYVNRTVRRGAAKAAADLLHAPVFCSPTPTSCELQQGIPPGHCQTGMHWPVVALYYCACAFLASVLAASTQQICL